MLFKKCREKMLSGCLLASTIFYPLNGKSQEIRKDRSSFGTPDAHLRRALTVVLRNSGFTGRIESTLEPRLGRPIDPTLADLGRLLWFDVTVGLHDDNTCGGCHSPTNGMGDSQSIAIGIQNNHVVGPQRAGPRNQRRTPAVANTAFYPKLMWNGRFFAPSGDPFDNSQGFVFPLPEGAAKFPPHDRVVSHLLIAQGHLPPTELTEVAGFTGTLRPCPGTVTGSPVPSAQLRPLRTPRLAPRASAASNA